MEAIVTSPDEEMSAPPIQSEVIRQVVAWWQDARQGRLMPEKGDLDPIAIPQALPNIWISEHDPVRNTFTYKLLGESIRDLHDRPMKGLTIQEAYPPPEASRIQKVFEEVAQLPGSFHRTGRIYGSRGRIGHGERLMLPLGGDRIPARHILGISVYTIDSGRWRGGPTDFESLRRPRDAGRVYPLRALERN